MVKKTLRPFVVETRQGKKSRSWSVDLDSSAEPSRGLGQSSKLSIGSGVQSAPLAPGWARPAPARSRSDGELSAAQVFAKFTGESVSRDVDAGPSTALREVDTASERSAGPRVLPDLTQASKVPPTVEVMDSPAESVDEVFGLHVPEPKVAPARRGRKPKEKAIPSVVVVPQPDGEDIGHGAVLIDLPVEALVMPSVRVEPMPVQTHADSIWAEGNWQDGVAVPLTAQRSAVSKRWRSGRKDVEVKDLPRGQRWKRRLPPSAR